MEGTIYKGVGGFYDVLADDGSGMVSCKPRGIFRKRGQKPLAGDRVRLEYEAGTAFISEILPRKNCLVRPAVANVDRLFVVASTAAPAPNFLVIDKMTAAAFDAGIEPVLVVTKTDLAQPNALMQAYARSGIACITVCASTKAGTAQLMAMLEGRLSVFCGNSGVGKSTLLNALLPQAQRPTGDISAKLGRGRHTTREVELFAVGGGLVADTPGFSSFDLQSVAEILPENLQLCFPEIKARIGQCKFSGCAHLKETGCAVRAAVEAGEIAQSRHDSYVALHAQAKQAQNTY